MLATWQERNNNVCRTVSVWLNVMRYWCCWSLCLSSLCCSCWFCVALGDLWWSVGDDCVVVAAVVVVVVDIVVVWHQHSCGWLWCAGDAVVVIYCVCGGGGDFYW